MAKVQVKSNIHINYTHETNSKEQINNLKENNKKFTEEANRELIECLSKALGVPKENIKVKVKYEVVEE